jgi:hypothetical protein
MLGAPEQATSVPIHTLAGAARGPDAGVPGLGSVRAGSSALQFP